MEEHRLVDAVPGKGSLLQPAQISGDVTIVGKNRAEEAHVRLSQSPFLLVANRWRSGELAEGPVVASSPFNCLSLAGIVTGTVSWSRLGR